MCRGKCKVREVKTLKLHAAQPWLMRDGTHDAGAFAAAAMIEQQVQVLQTSKAAEIEMEIWKNDRGGQQLKG